LSYGVTKGWKFGIGVKRPFRAPDIRALCIKSIGLVVQSNGHKVPEGQWPLGANFALQDFGKFCLDPVQGKPDLFH
jgi:hypothetical protein